MTMVLMTGLAMTRERERGTMENLLAMPVRPLEVMLGKIVPYVFVDLQAVAARLVFGVPMLGDLTFLALSMLVSIAANLTLGLTFSTVARNHLQAMQMGFFFFLPSILLSGFMFPFRGMPEWAQTLGELLPLTHFLRLVRGILLKGYDASENAASSVAHVGVPAGGACRRAAALSTHPGLKGMGGPGTAAVAVLATVINRFLGSPLAPGEGQGGGSRSAICDRPWYTRI